MASTEAVKYTLSYIHTRIIYILLVETLQEAENVYSAFSLNQTGILQL